MNLIDMAETGWIPDALIRVGIRQLLANRVRSNQGLSAAQIDRIHREFAAQLRSSPLAVDTDKANEQHYEVPAEFFVKVLGPRLKYSACLFTAPQATLSVAEEDMLRQTCERAEIENGMRVLELGCGWGSLTLWMAEQFPACEITAISNSVGQRLFIERQASARGLTNVRVLTADMRDFDINEQFDRIVSVEMFEHMRNYELLLRRVSQWLTREGKAFVHIFCHRDAPYFFETEGAVNWMGRHFFTGGMMPSADLFGLFREDLTIENQWRVNGLHYGRTCDAWLMNLDAHREAILRLFEKNITPREAKRHLQRWRMFFMACAELFRYRQGEEWFVGHYLFQQSNTSRLSNSPGVGADSTLLPSGGI